MQSNKKIITWIGVGVYACLLFLVLTLYRLPADKLIAASIGNISQGKWMVAANKISPLLLRGYKLEEISYGMAYEDTVVKDTLKSLTLGMDYKRLFIGYLPFHFKGIMPRGDIQGITGVSMLKGAEKGYMDLEITDVFLEDLDILRSLLDRGVKGRLKGEIHASGNMTDLLKMSGEGRLSVEEGAIDTKFDLPEMKNIPFSLLTLLFSIKEGVLKLEKGEMNGPLLSGIYSGEIRLKKIMHQSRINLTGEMRPGPMLASNKLMSQLFSKILKGKETVKVSITGTFARPSIVRS